MKLFLLEERNKVEKERYKNSAFFKKMKEREKKGRKKARESRD